MTPDPISFDAPENAETEERSRGWWLVVLLLSTVSWAAVIAVGVAIIRLM